MDRPGTSSVLPDERARSLITDKQLSLCLVSLGRHLDSPMRITKKLFNSLSTHLRIHDVESCRMARWRKFTKSHSNIPPYFLRREHRASRHDLNKLSWVLTVRVSALRSGSQKERKITLRMLKALWHIELLILNTHVSVGKKLFLLTEKVFKVPCSPSIN